MDNIARKIVDIEYKAQNIIKEAEQERNKLKVKIDEELEALRKEALLKADATVKAERAKKLDFAQKEAQRILLEAKQKTAAMEENYARNRENWIRSLYDFCLRR